MNRNVTYAATAEVWELVPDQAPERLAALEGADVWVGIVRAVGGHGGAVVRAGRLRLAVPAQRLLSIDHEQDGQIRIADVVDEFKIAIATVLSTDTLWVFNGVIRAERRPSFFVEIYDRRPPGVEEPSERLTYLRFSRDLTAELEAGLRESLVVRPDPDPPASWKAAYPSMFVPDSPQFDEHTSIQYAANMSYATVSPNGTNGARLSCLGITPRRGEAAYSIFEPAAGSTYSLTVSDLMRIGADIRSFLGGRRDGFVLRSQET